MNAKIVLLQKLIVVHKLYKAVTQLLGLFVTFALTPTINDLLWYGDNTIWFLLFVFFLSGSLSLICNIS